MSPRAAARLETIGFTQVFDYVAGKADWRAGGMAVEGEMADQLTVQTALANDGVTVAPLELLGNVRSKTEKAGKDAAIVVSPDGVVLGRIRGRNLSKDSSLTAELAMRPGPTTIRPDMKLEAAVEWMKSAGIKSVLVTDPEGRLLGTLYLDRAMQLLPD